MTGLRHVAHRPPLSAGSWALCAAAYLLPAAWLVSVTPSAGRYEELIWVVTLVPAFLLSLHYGLRGAVLGILAGTALFVLTRVVHTRSGAESDLGAAVVIYGAYGTLVITVGWLSEQLHDHYTTTLERERLAAIGHVAVALRHEVNNALTTIMAESELLAAGDAGGPAQCRAAGRTISDAAARIAADIRKMTNLQTSPVVEYRDGMQMLDLQQARERPDVTEDS